jgi:hypothetical protein
LKRLLLLAACLLSASAFGATGADTCNNVPASADTLTGAGTFATTCTIQGGVYDPGNVLVIRAQGVLTTSGTANPVEDIQVNAFGTTGLCTHSGNNSLNLNLTAVSWDIVCFVRIVTTGNPGTATTWGTDEAVSANTSGTFVSHNYPQNATTQSAITTTSQTVSIQVINTPVAGQSFTLQGLTVQRASQ